MAPTSISQTLGRACSGADDSRDTSLVQCGAVEWHLQLGHSPRFPWSRPVKSSCAAEEPNVNLLVASLPPRLFASVLRCNLVWSLPD